MGTIADLEMKRRLPSWTERDEAEYQEILSMCLVPLMDDDAQARMREMQIHIGNVVRQRSGVA